MCFDEDRHSLQPDFTIPPDYSWTYDGSTLDRTGKVLSNKFGLDQPDKVGARRRTVAYNFSSITSTHVILTGLVKSNILGRP